MENDFDFKTILSIFGAFGGVLSLLTFFESYILRFSPKFFPSKFGFLWMSDKNILDRIILGFEIGNHRKRYGSIIDIGLKFEVENHKGAFSANYSAKGECGELLSSQSTEPDLSSKPFSPINLLPFSTKKYTISFEPVEFSSGVKLIPSFISIEIYFRTDSSNKWRYAGSYSFLISNEHIESSRIFKFEVINSTDRIDGLQSVKARKRNYGYVRYSNWLIDVFFSSLFTSIRKLLSFFKRLIFFILVVPAKFVFNRLQEKFFVKKVLRRSKLRSRTMQFMINGGKPSAFLLSSIKRLGAIIENLSSVDTDGSLERVKIAIINNKVEVSNGIVRLEVEASGTHSFRVYGTSIRVVGPIYFTAEYKSVINKYGYWQVNQSQVMDLRSIGVLILDVMAFYSTEGKINML